METNRYAHCSSYMLAAFWEYAINRDNPEQDSWVELCHECDSRKLYPSKMLELLKTN